MQIPKYLATQNLNKLREINQILGAELEHVPLDLVEEQSLDLNTVVQAKAKDAYQKFGQPILVEDTGLAFDAWNGLPGPLIKLFLESVQPDGVIKMMANESNRGVTATTMFAFYDGKECHMFKGELRGRVADQVRGKGFGWDPIFIPEGFEITYGEMQPEQKNSISHRYKALVDLKRWM